MLGNESFYIKNKRKSEHKNLNIIKLKLSNIKPPKVKLSDSQRKKRKSNNSNYLSETLSKKNRRESENEYKGKMKLDISKIKSPCSMLSITPKKKIINNFEKKISTKNSDPSKIKKLIEKKINFNYLARKRFSCYVGPINSNVELNRKDSKRHSLELLQTKTSKIYQKYNLKENGENLIKPNNNKNIINPSHLNEIENNIKNVLSNMLIKIEKNKVKLSEKDKEYFSPEIKPVKLQSSPSLKFIFTKKKVKSNKKKDLQSSLYIKGTNCLSFSFTKKDKKRRNRSFDFNGSFKKKIIKKIRNKLMQKSNDKLTTIQNTNIVIDDESDINENYYGFSFFPNSNYILIFDFILIVSNLYTFIIIPLNAARNKNLREKDVLIQEIFHYLIDIIFLFDFIISLFRGYYDFEMNIIRNNKKIIIHYLKSYFFIDFLQAIPLFTLIRIFMKPSKYVYYGKSEYESLLIVFLLFIKPLKVFKILRKKQNKALEDFYSYLSENYYLEKLAKFLIYFLVFFLFVHLFICLHIYFALQGYPNWISNINILNQNFLSKYIASLYFMITTMTTVGYGDIVCISSIERFYHIILLFIGTLLYTFLVSKIGNYLRDESYEQIKLSKDLNILENIRVTYPQMSFKLYSKIKNHLLSIFEKRKKTGISLLINGIPDAIKNDLLFKIYSKVINGFIIFKGVKNSNFVLQMLTSFIPIVIKKEEIIVLEGEIIQNIVFVKDGRLQLELSIDLNDPLNSIIAHLKNNFVGISRQEELKNYNCFKKPNNNINNNSESEKSYNNLKEELDILLMDNRKTIVDNTIIDGNGISVDLGRLDFSRNEINQNIQENFQIIKIIDVRKNEHYGDVNMFLGQPSPFTLKSKTRIAELFLLRKHDMLIMSKNFPNIWRRIQNKSYHNLVSIKKLTFKILKQYYDTHFYSKDKTDNNILANLNATKNLSMSSFDNRPSFLKNLKTFNKSQSLNSVNRSFNANISRSINKSSNKTLNKYYYRSNNFLENSKFKISSTNNHINRSKLHPGLEQKRKSDADSFGNELNFSLDSYNSNLNSVESSHFKFTNSIINSNKKKECLPIINIYREENNKNETPKKKNTFKTSSKKNINNSENENFTFNNGSESNKLTFFSPKKIKNISKSKSIQSKYKITKDFRLNSSINQNDNLIMTLSNTKKSSKGDIIYNSSNKETIKYSKNNFEKMSNKSNDINFITLEDVNLKFSQKIKRKIKKRKQLQKLKELLRLQKLKIDKNLIEMYVKNNIIKKKNSIDKLSNSQNDISHFSSSNYKINSQIISLDSEGNSTTLCQTSRKFKDQSLKRILSQSFVIKSSYKNFNMLSKGEIINDKKFEKFIENSINQYFSIYAEDNKTVFSLFSPKNNRNKKREDYFKYNKNQNKKDDENEGSSLSLLTSKHFSNLFLEVPNVSNRKFNYNIKTEKTTIDIPASTGEINKKSSKLFEKEFEKIKLSSFKKSDKELKKLGNNIKNNFLESNLNLKGKQLYKPKHSNKIKEKLNYKDKHSVKSSFKELYEIDNSKNGNKYSLINKKDNTNNNSSFNIIQINNFEEKKWNNCYIF